MRKRNVRSRVARIGRTAGAVAIGAAAGSLFALLWAPRSGRSTRRQLGLHARSLRRAAARQAGQTRRLLSREATSLCDATTASLSDARTWMTAHLNNDNGHVSGHRVRRTNGHRRVRRSARRHAVRHAHA